MSGHSWYLATAKRDCLCSTGEATCPFGSVYLLKQRRLADAVAALLLLVLLSCLSTQGSSLVAEYVIRAVTV